MKDRPTASPRPARSPEGLRREPDHPAVRSQPPGPPTFEEHWASLEPEFRSCLDLAWASCCAGSLGVGSIITDTRGSVVATGRNRSLEADTGDDHLAGSPVAHVEVNALGKLRAFDDHDSFTLWTSLEPCLLCAGGIRLAGVGSVRFLAADPLWSNLAALPSIDPFIADRWPRMEGPRSDAFGAFARLLPFHAVSFWSPSSAMAVSWNEDAPALGRLAAELVESHELVALASSSAPLEEVIGELWSRLQGVEAEPERG